LPQGCHSLFSCHNEPPRNSPLYYG
jgi:hypothetical protein